MSWLDINGWTCKDVVFLHSFFFFCARSKLRVKIRCINNNCGALTGNGCCIRMLISCSWSADRCLISAVEEKAKQNGSQRQGRCVGGDNERRSGRPIKREGGEEEDEKGKEDEGEGGGATKETNGAKRGGGTRRNKELAELNQLFPGIAGIAFHGVRLLPGRDR